jgi:hypothetical protein
MHWNKNSSDERLKISHVGSYISTNFIEEVILCFDNLNCTIATQIINFGRKIHLLIKLYMKKERKRVRVIEK